MLKGPGSENEQALTTSWSMKLLIAAVIVAFGALIGWGFLTGRNVAAVEAERERAIKAPIRVSGEAGETVITLDMETQQRSGIETAALPSAPHREELRAYGMVLDVARLTELNNNYANAKAQVQTAQAKLAMSKPAFERAQKLFNETSRCLTGSAAGRGSGFRHGPSRPGCGGGAGAHPHRDGIPGMGLGSRQVVGRWSRR